MTPEETLAGNKLIAEFMGYIYFHAGIDIDDSDCGGCYERKQVFSKVPILVNEYTADDQYYFAELPNPDFGNTDNPRWNPAIERLSWGTLNWDKYTHELEYDSDWNKLMAVLQKIEDIDEGKQDDTSNNFHFYICKRFTRVIYDWNGWEISAEQCATDIEKFKRFENSSKDYRHIIFDNDKIKSTWQAVVDFIKWYNQKEASRK